MDASFGKTIIDRLQEFTEALEQDQVISEKFTCRQIVLDLEPTSYNANDVRKTRNLLNISQALFAKFIGVSVKTVRAWEQGTNTPNDQACRFMDEIQHDPQYWKHRLIDSAAVKRPRATVQ
jgi:putative transcriptional regulator